MFGDKKPRGTWLIKLFRRCAVGSFILMMGLFALYGISEFGREYIFGLSQEATDRETNNVQDDKPMTEQWLESPEVEKEEIRVETIEEVEDDEALEVIQYSVEDTGEMSNTQVESDSVDDRNQDIATIEVKSQKETSEELQAEVDKAFEEESLQEFVEIPVHGKYTVSITDEMLTGLEGVVKEYGLNPTKIVGEYVKELALKERLQLLNFTLEKAKQIDVLELWNLVADGITQDDVVILQGMIEDNFTTDEVDRLYEQYMQYVIADGQVAQE